MLKYAVILALLAPAAFAEEFSVPAIPGNGKFSFDFGVGISAGPSYPGSDDIELGPWVTMRNASFGEPGKAELDGFAFFPSFGYVGERKAEDDGHLTGMDDIDRAYELGGRVNYGFGHMTSYVTTRVGFGGHDGITGEVGFRYRTDISDRLTLWSGLEAQYGNGSYNETYFGVSPHEALASGFEAYDPNGGVTKASAKFSARYSLNEVTAVLGEVEYGRLVGAAGDSPLVEDRTQPVVRLGISRNFSFNF
jgi:outer membrane protein